MATLCPVCSSPLTDDDTCPRCTVDDDYGPFYWECLWELERGPRAYQECGKPFMRLLGVDYPYCATHAAIQERREVAEERRHAPKELRFLAGLFLGGGKR